MYKEVLDEWRKKEMTTANSLEEEEMYKEVFDELMKVEIPDRYNIGYSIDKVEEKITNLKNYLDHTNLDAKKNSKLKELFKKLKGFKFIDDTIKGNYRELTGNSKLYKCGDSGNITLFECIMPDGSNKFLPIYYTFMRELAKL